MPVFFESVKVGGVLKNTYEPKRGDFLAPIL